VGARLSIPLLGKRSNQEVAAVTKNGNFLVARLRDFRDLLVRALHASRRERRCRGRIDAALARRSGLEISTAAALTNDAGGSNAAAFAAPIRA
jgi:hypothetical protein